MPYSATLFLFFTLMAVSRDQKAEILKTLNEEMKSAKAVFFAKNLGLSVADSQKMRRALRDGGSRFCVAKKTLIKKAAAETLQIEIDDSVMDGAVGAAFSTEDEFSAVKILAKFAKSTEKIEIVGGIFEGKAISKNDAITLSQIPSREELLSKMLGSLMSPLSGFVGVGNAVISGFVRVVDGIRKQKESA